MKNLLKDEKHGVKEHVEWDGEFPIRKPKEPVIVEVKIVVRDM